MAEETKENQKLYSVFIFLGFFLVAYDVIYFGQIIGYGEDNLFFRFINAFNNMAFLKNPMFTKLSTLVLLALVGIGTVSKKQPNVNIISQIIVPLILGLILIFSCLLIYPQIIKDKSIIFYNLNLYQILYALFSIVGAISFVVSIGNIRKILKSNFGKDVWNIEGESFMQEQKKIESPTTINIPTLFDFSTKEYNGWININPFRGVMVIGTPGSGKSYGIINPIIRQMIEKNFTMCIYDYKYPDLAQIAYYRYLKTYAHSKQYRFKVLNLDDIENSVRVNPNPSRYIRTLAESQETAACIVESLQKTDTGGGSEVFFKESAIDLLGAAIYFLAKYEGGKYSDVPHLISLICTEEYEDLFDILYSNSELRELLSAFASAYKHKSFDQLEGQIGTLRVFLSKLATKEAYYIFSGDELDLHLSNPEHPTILILASNPQTQNINSTLLAMVVSRITKLVNSKGNLPFGLIADEVPTLYIHKVEELLATARSNKVGVVMGLQELPQFRKQYGKDKADTITSVVANLFSGSARNPDTLNWLENTFGKKKQVTESISINRRDTNLTLSEKLENVIPKGKISQLQTGEIVGIYAKDYDSNKGKKIKARSHIPPMVHCRINLDREDINTEESNYSKIPNQRQFKGNKDEYLSVLMEQIRQDIADMATRARELKKQTAG